MLIIFPSIAFAETAEISVDCNTSKKKNENVTCEVKANFSYGINAIDYEFSYDESKFTYVGFEADKAWEAMVEGNSFTLLSTDEHQGEFRLGTLTFKAKEKKANPNVKNIKIEVSDSEYNAIDVLNESNNVKDDNKIELKKATTSKNHLIYDIIIIIVVLVAILIMMGLVIIRVIRSDTK